MKEWITGRNPVYEMLRAKRRQIFRLLIAEGVKADSRISEIIQIVRPYKIQVETVKRAQLDSLSDNHQGVAAEVSTYPYSDLGSILKLAKQKEQDPFILVLDTLQNPQNLGNIITFGRSLRCAWCINTIEARHWCNPGCRQCICRSFRTHADRIRQSGSIFG